jgi:hypothetical protein
MHICDLNTHAKMLDKINKLETANKELIETLRWVLKHDGYLSVKQVLSKYTDDIKLTEEEKKILNIYKEE